MRAIDSVELTARTALPSTVADIALREVDRARRVTGLTSFPIPDYDTLTVKGVVAALDGLSESELQEVGEHERAHANRKSVLAALARRLKA